MVASKNLSAPVTTIPLFPRATKEQGELLVRTLSRLTLLSLVRSDKGGVEVRERLLHRGGSGNYVREYLIKLHFYPAETVKRGFGLELKEILDSATSNYAEILMKKVLNIVKRMAKSESEQNASKASRFAMGSKSGGERRQSRKSAVDSDEGEDEIDDETDIQTSFQKKKSRKEYEEEYEFDDEEAQGTLRIGMKKEMATYDDGKDDDEDEETILRDLSPETSDDEELAAVPLKAKSKPCDFEAMFDPEECTIKATLQIPVETTRILMVDLATRAARETVVQCTGRNGRAFLVDQVVDGAERKVVQLEGDDIESLWSLPLTGSDSLLDLNRLSSNHIYRLLQCYGVEACRAAIPQQIHNVFNVYGIKVDVRHLKLVADYMTYFGDYRPLSRHGLSNSSSPCLQMSYEMTTFFLIQAALQRSVDSLRTPSGSLVLGQVGRFGTGTFDLVVPAGAKL